MAHLNTRSPNTAGSETDLDEIWGTLSTLFAAGRGRF